MKHQIGLDDLYVFLASLNIAVTGRQREQMGLYLDLLKHWSAKQNLVSRHDLSSLVERHFVPSLYLHTCLPEKITGALMDLGSGAGFPGVPIAIMRPGVAVTLLDSSRKKTLFLEEVCKTTALRCQVICQRCEVYAQYPLKKYKFIVARAVAKISRLLEWTDGLLENKGALYALKGGDEATETENGGLSAERYQIFRPEQAWTDFSNHMREKYVLCVEK